MNVVDSLLQDDALLSLGGKLDEKGLLNIRANILKIHGFGGRTDQPVRSSESAPYAEDVPSLFNGEILHETGDDADPFGLGMAPLA